MIPEPALLEYRGFGPRPAVCLVFASPDSNSAAVADIADNERTSVTNAIEEIAQRLKQQFDATDVWHYMAFSPVTQKPTWYRIEWAGEREFRWPIWSLQTPGSDPFMASVVQAMPVEPNLDWAKRHNAKRIGLSDSGG